MRDLLTLINSVERLELAAEDSLVVKLVKRLDNHEQIAGLKRLLEEAFQGRRIYVLEPGWGIEPAGSGFCIRHVDGRWRTLDTIGMPDWTDEEAKALCFRLREHADAYAADDPDDVRIVQSIIVKEPPK